MDWAHIYFDLLNVFFLTLISFFWFKNTFESMYDFITISSFKSSALSTINLHFFHITLISPNFIYSICAHMDLIFTHSRSQFMGWFNIFLKNDIVFLYVKIIYFKGYLRHTCSVEIEISSFRTIHLTLSKHGGVVSDPS